MNKSTLVALRRFMFSASMENGVDAAHALDAEIAAIEAEARGGAYVPKVGDVVRSDDGHDESDYIVTAANPMEVLDISSKWAKCSPGLWVGTASPVYSRPATPSERIAAGLDKATTEARQACPMCNKPLGVKSATDATPYQRMLDSLTCECGEHDDEPPAPPPARPKRVKVTGNIPYPANRGTLVDGTLLNVKKWSSEGTPRPLATWPDGFDRYLHEGEWVPADEPEGEEAREREAAVDACPYGENTVSRFIFIEGWLARAKVKS